MSLITPTNHNGSESGSYRQGKDIVTLFIDIIIEWYSICNYWNLAFANALAQDKQSINICWMI